MRHGVTAWNKEGRAQGSSNVSLDEEGIEAAKKLAMRLANEEWDIIFTSPMTRARQTADILAGQSTIEVVEDERLRERHGGLIEGTTEQERQHRWGPDWRNLDLQLETAESVVARGLEFINEQGEIVLKLPNIGLQSSSLNKIKNILTVAGGKGKALAISSYLKTAPSHTWLITDEAAAKEILNGGHPLK